MMIHLAVSNGGQCLFKRSSADWVSTGLRICRGSCLKRFPPKTSVLRSSTIAVPFLPQRWLTRETVPLRGFSPKHKRDKVPANFALIYRKFMTDKLLLIFYGVATGLTFLLGSVYFLVAKVMEYDNSKVVEIPWTGLSVPAYVLHYGLILALVICWPLYLHLKFLRHQVIRIYHNSDSEVFVGIVKNNFRKRKIEFTLKDVEPVLERDTGRTDNIVIKGKGYTIFEPDFINTGYVNMLMRYL